MLRLVRLPIAFVLIAAISMQGVIGASPVTIDVNTRIYVETEQEVIGKKKLASEGQVVPSRVWRNVVVDGRVVIAAGTPVLVRLDAITKAKIAGRKGQVSLGAYEVETVDGSKIQLSGGYNKEGGSRMAGAIIGAVFLLPLIFIKGKAAKLPVGTVFDAFTGARVECQVESATELPRMINLSHVLEDIVVEVLYDELESTEKPTHFTFRIESPIDAPRVLVIDTINGEPTDPLELEIRSVTEDEETVEMTAAVRIKSLAKRFAKGINRFDIAYVQDGERTATEVVLNIQF